MSAALPRIAVTMGDGAGIGPEIIVKALPTRTSPPWRAPSSSVTRCASSRPPTSRASPSTSSPSTDVEQASEIPGRINVIDLGLLPEDLPFGELSAVAGDAAYHYIRVAAELAMAGKVQAICTAPLNKEALHAGGHIFPGHTELLAHLTGTPEVSMMLSTERVKVIHVTTHIGLIDAVDRIEPGLVERIIRRGHEALVDAGNPNPKIGVCGINPHAGENGLFGYGEEEAKIDPGVEAAAPTASTCTAPLPADTALLPRRPRRLRPRRRDVPRPGPRPGQGARPRGGRQHHRSACPSSAPRSTTAPPSTSPAPASPTTVR